MAAQKPTVGKVSKMAPPTMPVKTSKATAMPPKKGAAPAKSGKASKKPY